VGSELLAGDHPPPDAKGGSSKSPRPRATAAPLALPDVATSQQAAKEAADAAAVAKKRANGAIRRANDVRKKLRQAEPYKWVLTRSYKLSADTARTQTAEALTWGRKGLDYANGAIAANAEAQKIDSGSTAEKDKKAAQVFAEDAKANAENADIQSKEAAKSADAAVRNAPRKAYPPFDSISHSVQFTVSYTGTLSPNWSLVQWRGPSGNLASAQGSRVNTLNIALGPRSDADGKSSVEHDRALGILALRQLRIVGPPGTTLP
jgi:hypothetical protein